MGGGNGGGKEEFLRRKQRQISLGTIELISVDQVGPYNLPLGLFV